ncbi:WD40-repeat-containing domain protein [Xylariomycetidae sp. FL2044]|nr:WD40-repeat-containing domain protein [Xylariomycetidae sp. FL2044]
MRPPGSPPTSASSTPTPPVEHDDAYLQLPLPESSTSIATFSHHSHPPTNPQHDSSSPEHTPQSPAASAATTAAAVDHPSDTAEQDDRHDHNHYMMDTEDGGASPASSTSMDTQEELNHPPAFPLSLQGEPLEPMDVAPPPTLTPPHITPVPAQPIFHLPQPDPPVEPAVIAPWLPVPQFQDPALAVDDTFFFAAPPPNALAPENHGLGDFLHIWAAPEMDGAVPTRHRPAPCLREVHKLQRSRSISRIHYDDLDGDRGDMQAINWERLGVPRSIARRRRREIFRNFVNQHGSDNWYGFTRDTSLPAIENYFRFQSMDVRRNVQLLHFQLRNILGCSSWNRTFYPSRRHGVREVDPTSGQEKLAMKYETESDALVSTLATGEDILVVGGFNGDYRFRHLESEAAGITSGRLTHNPSGITNHVQIHSSRSSSAPLACFASNDFGLRVLDLTTNSIVSKTMYEFALNCSVLSPDKRLRVMVGDNQNVLLTNAETGEIFQKLGGHRDYGFSCDWAPDGWTVATGNQDKNVLIWDARKWTNSKGEAAPVTSIRMGLSGARSVRFSPLGSGKRILVAMEEADFINMIDAQTFNTKQTIDIFGELGGISFTNDGQDLMALCCDKTHGGIMRLGRCDAGAEDHFNYEPRRYHSRDTWRSSGYDWLQTPEQVSEQPGSQKTLTHKRRKAAMTEDWTVL